MTTKATWLKRNSLIFLVLVIFMRFGVNHLILVSEALVAQLPVESESYLGSV